MKITAIQYDNLMFVVNMICEHKDAIVNECNKSLLYALNYDDVADEELLSIIEDVKSLINRLDYNFNTINSITKNGINGSFKHIEESFSSYINSIIKN